MTAVRVAVVTPGLPAKRNIEMRHLRARTIDAASIALVTVLLAACGTAAGSPLPTDAPNAPSPTIDARIPVDPCVAVRASGTIR